jgi:hypothetical protein
MSAREDKANPTINLGAFRDQIGKLRQMTSKMIHHDSITGSSLIYIVYNETVGMHTLLDSNADTLSNLYTQTMGREHQMKVRDLRMCNIRINDRNLCPGPDAASHTTD